MTYRPETTLNYGLERAWSVAPTRDANKLAVGYGMMIVQIMHFLDKEIFWLGLYIDTLSLIHLRVCAQMKALLC
jgi:hypothetical protein